MLRHDCQRQGLHKPFVCLTTCRAPCVCRMLCRLVSLGSGRVMTACTTVLSAHERASCGKWVSVLATQSSHNLQLETACRGSLQWDHGRLHGQADLNICSSQPDAWPGRTETNAAAYSRSDRSKQGRDGTCACRVDQQICGCVRCTEIAAWLVF